MGTGRKKGSQSSSQRVKFARPAFGPKWSPPKEVGIHKPGHEVGWQSNGGDTRGHRWRSLPFSLDVVLPEIAGVATRIALMGVFALQSSADVEAKGTLGATIQFFQREEPLFRIDMLSGLHYADARQLGAVELVLGDGSSRRTVGQCLIEDEPARVDLLEIDVPPGTVPRSLRFRDLGSPASFVLFDVFVEYAPAKLCPFSGKGQGVALRDVPGILRLGDRVQFNRALEQVEAGIAQAEDMDEARGEAMTFLAVLAAASIESNPNREMHKAQLRAFRELERAQSCSEICETVRREVAVIAPNLFSSPTGRSASLVERSLEYVDRNYAKPLTDSTMAQQLGLSTSHFRYLFKRATGMPFHKYVVAVRLEKARSMLREQGFPVSQVAEAVGFSGLSHFSRAFSTRFSVSPSAVRRSD